MSGAPLPQIILEPIASDAGAGFITTPIPDAPTGTNAASMQQGFPPIKVVRRALLGNDSPTL